MTTTTTVTSLPPPSVGTTTKLHLLPPPDKLALLIDKSKTITQLLQIHATLIRRRLDDHPILNLKLQRSYSSLGCLDYSVLLLERTHNPDVFLYTAAIHAHAVNNIHEQAAGFYVRMLAQGIQPNAFTFSAILKSCPLEPGRAFHSQALKFGLDSDTYVRTALLDGYARGGDVASAKQLFDCMSEKSLVTLTAMLACYARHGDVESARVLFDGMMERDAVCWNVMIDGYTKHGRPNEALVLFRQMLSVKVKPNEVTFVSVLSACGQLGALGMGRWVHSYIENNGIRMNVLLGTALVDMYNKCGQLEDARVVFDMIKDKDVVAWNSMIVGYAMHGINEAAFKLFDNMRRTGLCPSDISFIGILNACSHAGLIAEGWQFFHSMKHDYGIEPKIEHYGCMVNLLGRAGKLEEAYELVMDMKIDPDPPLWGTLLCACRLHGNVTLAEEIVDFLVGRNLAHSGTYVLLSNIYAAAKNWDGVAKVRKMMRENGVQKEPGCSSIEVNNKVHEFLAGDLRHPKRRGIYTMLEEVNGWLKARGYTPTTDIVLHDMEDTKKEQSLEVHSEKLAIAFGLISTQPGTTIRIAKNLRVCSDCHAVTKLISEITGRKIIVRDRNRFHHFVNGSCSCEDYW